MAPFRRVAIVTCHITERCNLNCAYCRNAANVGGRPFMTLGTLGRSAAWVADRTGQKKVTWVLFGGEPLLRPVEWLFRAVEEVQSQFGRRGIDVTVSFQTNGTLLDGPAARLMARHGLRPCISVDGPRDLHDLCRQGGGRTWDGIRLLKAHGIVPRIICVLGRHNYPFLDRVLEAFDRWELPVVRINFVSPSPGCPAAETLGWEEMLAARRKIAERMLAGPDRLRELNVSRMMRLYALGAPARPDAMRACGAPICGAGITHVSINTDGDVYLCDRTINRDAAWRLCSVGGPDAPAETASRIRRFHFAHRVWPSCRRCACRTFCLHPCCLDRRAEGTVESHCRSVRHLGQWLGARRREVLAWARRDRDRPGRRGLGE